MNELTPVADINKAFRVWLLFIIWNQKAMTIWNIFSVVMFYWLCQNRFQDFSIPLLALIFMVIKPNYGWQYSKLTNLNNFIISWKMNSLWIYKITKYFITRILVQFNAAMLPCSPSFYKNWSWMTSMRDRRKLMANSSMLRM